MGSVEYYSIELGTFGFKQFFKENWLKSYHNKTLLDDLKSLMKIWEKKKPIDEIDENRRERIQELYDDLEMTLEIIDNPEKHIDGGYPIFCVNVKFILI